MKDIVQSEVENFLDGRCYEIHLETKEIMTMIHPTFSGTWAVDKESLQNFLQASLIRSITAFAEEAKQKIGEDEKYPPEPMYDERDNFGLVKWYEEQKKIDKTNTERTRVKSILDNLIKEAL